MMKLRAAILLSRQPMRPTAKSTWIQKSKEAIHWIAENGFSSIYTSIGMSTWELLIVLASQNKVHQYILIPANNIEHFHSLCQSTAYQFKLDNTMVEFMPVFPDKDRTSRNDLMQKRDKTVFENADVLLPVSIRQNGFMDRLVSEFSNKRIIQNFRVPYEKHTAPLSYRIDRKKLSQKIKDIRTDQYIIHWTRTANSAWPTERLCDYYTSILEADTYPRSALATLKNIMETKRIIASSKHMPKKIASVSFSSLSPYEMTPLIRWRARYLQMSFEPYGIGIESQYALASNIYPVRYYDKKSYHNLSKNDSWLYQSTGIKTDWRVEHEFRYRGDFNLSLIPINKLICFCFNENEAATLENLYDIRTLAFIW